MHESVMDFVSWVTEIYPPQGNVLEVGSRNVNGSVRECFAGCSYTGIDIEGGPDVDKILSSYQLAGTFGREFDYLVCCEMLEHDDAPWVTLRQMFLVAKPDAKLVLTCRGYDETGCFHIHDYPHDVWRFSRRGVEVLLTHTGWIPRIVRADPQHPGVLAYATRAA